MALDEAIREGEEEMKFMVVGKYQDPQEYHLSCVSYAEKFQATWVRLEVISDK